MNRVLLVAFTLSIAACGGPPLPTDGGDAEPIDAPTDTLPASTLRPCRAAADCNPRETCDLTFPGGLCMIAGCSSSQVCPRTQACVNGLCRPRCTQGGGECEPIRAVCLAVDASDPSVRACTPSCYTMPPAGAPMCITGAMCDPYRGICTTAPNTMGAENGAPCRTGADCRSGRCLGETIDRPAPGTPTGFVDGYCISVGRQLSATDFNSRIGGELPRSNCPIGSIVLPDREAREGDPTVCWRECDDTRPCREGYACEHLQTTDAMGRMVRAFRNGGCVPIDCTQPGEACPADYYCQTHEADAAQTYGICARRTGGNDGGVPDAARDAAVDAAIDAGADATTDGAMDSGGSDSSSMDAGGGPG